MFKVFDDKGKPYVAYALVINGVVIRNSTYADPFAVHVTGGTTYKIECYAIMYKPVIISQVYLKPDEDINITINLKNDERAVSD